MRISYKKFAGDAGLNIISVAIPIAVLQFLILPSIASSVGSIEYGQIVTIISLLTLCAEPLGFSLNNTRLLVARSYHNQKLEGDFNYLVLWCIPIIFFFITCGISYYAPSYNGLNTIFLVLISIFIFLQKYYEVDFRLNLNYRGILFISLFLCAGYIVGWGCFFVTGSWIYVYLVGCICSLGYSLKNNPLLHESLKSTTLFFSTLHTSIILLFVEFLSSVTKYADRMFLYPLLGGSAVATYYSATIISKMIILIVSPISSVVLSYFSRLNTLSRQSFLMMLGVTSVIGIIGYVGCILVARPVLNYLYPDWAAESMKLVYITTASSVINSAYCVIRPAILKFRNINLQVLLSGMDVVFYIIFSYLGYLFGELQGFCVGLLIYSVLQLSVRIVIFIFQK